MRLLLDTHVLLWWLDDNPALAEPAHRAIRNGNNVVFVSAASVWEIRIKQALGKLTIPIEFKDVLAKQQFLSLDITTEHAYAVADLPSHHRDPFDRMLVAQATVERLTIVTHDTQLKPYGVRLLLT